MKKIKRRIYAWLSRRYMHGCSNFNELEVRRGCRSKEQARAVFAKNDMPHARGAVFFSPLVAHRFAKTHGFPLVIKPNVSGYSRGSYFPIQNFTELWRAMFLAKAWWPTTVVEQYLRGANYRVLATPDKLISVIRRYPPFVDGDGESTIAELIARENQTRAEMQLHPVIFPIDKNSKLIARHLKKQGLSLHSVPARGRRVEVFFRVALAPGGVVETIEQSGVAEENKKLFKRVVKMFNANVLGIDVIFERGIETAHAQQKCILIEVNSRPYLPMHEFPRYGKREDFSAHIRELQQLNIADTDIF